MPGLIIDSLGPIGGTSVDRSSVRDYIVSVWDGCDRLGMTAALLDGLTTAVPELQDRDSPGFHLLTGKARPGPQATYEAFVYALHDVIGVRVAMAENRADEGIDGWPTRYQEWRSVAPPEPLPDAFLGGSLLFFGLADRPQGSSDLRAEAVWQGLRACGLDCWEPALVTDDEVAVWEGPPADGRRVVAAVAPPSREADLGAWVWWRGEHELAPFPRYLLHAAKLRYESRVFDRRRASLNNTLIAVDSALERVLNLHRDVDVAGAATMPALLDAQGALMRAQVDQTGLVIEVSNLRQLQRTVTIAGRNLRALSPSADPEAPEVAGTLVGRDLALASWLSEQIEHDIGYADAVSERATEVHAMTSLRLQAASERVERARSRLDLIQTTLLGAVLYGVLAYGTFGISFEPNANLRLPLLATLAALLLALPTVGAHWHEPYRTFEHVGGVLLGASAGWLLVVAAWPDHAAPAIAAIGAAIGASLLAVLAMGLHDVHPSRSARPRVHVEDGRTTCGGQCRRGRA